MWGQGAVGLTSPRRWEQAKSQPSCFVFFPSVYRCKPYVYSICICHRIYTTQLLAPRHEKVITDEYSSSTADQKGDTLLYERERKGFRFCFVLFFDFSSALFRCNRFDVRYISSRLTLIPRTFFAPLIFFLSLRVVCHHNNNKYRWFFNNYIW